MLAAVAALGVLTLAPAAVSALGENSSASTPSPSSGRSRPTSPAYLGRPAAPEDARAAVPFPVRTIPSLGAPSAAYVRDDVAGGLVTLAFDEGRVMLAQWPADGVEARVAVVPVEGTAEDVTAGPLRALWIAGTARGTFTLVGADGAVHRELFEVSAGALLWREGGVGLLLQGAGSKARALELAADAGRSPSR